MDDYKIERLTPDRFEVLLPLMKDCFGINVNIEYFKWKFLDNPAGEFIGFIAVKKETEEIGAYYGVIPEVYWMQGVKEVVYQSCDTMTHSLHRRKGLFQKLAAHCYDYLEKNHTLFVIGFGGEQSTPGFIKLGWRKLFDFRFQFIPKILCLPSKFSSAYKGISEVSPSDIFHLKQNKSQARITTARTLKQFEWRLANPLHPAKIIAINLESYIAYYQSENKIFVLDFFFSSQSSAKKLTRYLRKIVIDNNLSGIVTITREKSKDMFMLRKIGFLKNPFSFGPLRTNIPFIFLAKEDKIEVFSDVANWEITSYEHDSF